MWVDLAAGVGGVCSKSASAASPFCSEVVSILDQIALF